MKGHGKKYEKFRQTDAQMLKQIRTVFKIRELVNERRKVWDMVADRAFKGKYRSVKRLRTGSSCDFCLTWGLEA